MTTSLLIGVEKKRVDFDRLNNGNWTSMKPPCKLCSLPDTRVRRPAAFVVETIMK